MYRFIISSFFLFLSMGFCHQAAAQASADDPVYSARLHQFQEFIQRGDVDQGLLLLDSLIEAYPTRAEAVYAKSLLYAQAGDIDTAIELAKKVVEISPKDLTFNNHLLNLYRSKRDSAAILDRLDILSEYYPKNIAIIREKMLVYTLAEQPENALKTYDEAVQLVGKSDTLDLVKSEILVGMGRMAEAKAILSEWYNTNTQQKEVYSSLAFIYNQEGDRKAAIDIIQTGLRNTGNDVLYLDLADIYLYRGDKKQMYQALQMAFKSKKVDFMEKQRVMGQLLANDQSLDLAQKQELAHILTLEYPRMPDVYAFKADVLWQRGNLEEARSLYLTSLGMNPNSDEIWRRLINIEIAVNDLLGAIGHGNEALIHFPNHTLIHYFTGIAYYLHDETDSAREHLEAALDYSEKENDYVKSMVYTALGDLYHKEGMVKVSYAAYEEAIQLDSTNASAYNNLAYYLSLRKEKLDKAAEYALKAISIDPSSGTFQDTYAWVLFQQENYQEALEWMEKAMKNSEVSAALVEHHGDILSMLGKKKDAVKQWEKALNLYGQNDSIDTDKLKLKIREKKYIE